MPIGILWEVAGLRSTKGTVVTYRTIIVAQELRRVRTSERIRQTDTSAEVHLDVMGLRS